MGHILATDQNFVSPLIEPRDVKRIGIVVYGSDDGLCGAFNVNVLKGFLVEINRLVELYGKNVEFDIFPVGGKMVKTIQRLRDNRFNVITTPGVDSKMGGEKVNEFTQSLKQLFVDHNLDLVSVVYMKYLSMSRQVLTCEQLFPVSEKAIVGDVKTDDNQLYIFEPDANSIFNEVLPMFVLSTMQEITIENRSSEQAARVMAMQSANDNAKKLLEELQLEYNKLRQQSITTELLDILGGQVER
jgi:F-type H+-transporting ATPase subunit gamma